MHSTIALLPSVLKAIISPSQNHKYIITIDINHRGHYMINMYIHFLILFSWNTAYYVYIIFAIHLTIYKHIYVYLYRYTKL